jgi:hypothetical protein
MRLQCDLLEPMSRRAAARLQLASPQAANRVRRLLAAAVAREHVQFHTQGGHMRPSTMLLAIGVLICFGGVSGSARAATPPRATTKAHATARVVVPAAPTRGQPGFEQGIVVEGDPDGGGGTPGPGGGGYPQAGDLMFRTGSIYAVQGTDPVSNIALPLSTPGNALSWDFVRSVFHVGDADYLAPKADGTYQFQPFGADEMKFNQVNAYHHVNKTLSHPLLVGLWGLNYTPADIFLFDGQNSSDPTIAAQTYGTSISLYRPQGAGGRHAAKDGDVLRHEATHAALLGVLPMGNEQLAGDPSFFIHQYSDVHEGLADYYAALLGGNKVIAEYIIPGGIRDLSSNPPADYKMANYISRELWRTPYEAGRILTGALFDLRANPTVGAAVVDELFTDALTDGCFATFRSIADGMRSEDIAFYNGDHLVALNTAFDARGIAPGSPPVAYIGGTGFAARNQPYQLYVESRGGYRPFTFLWEKSTNNGSTWTSFSTSDFPNPSFDADVLVRCTLTDHVGQPFVLPTALVRVFDTVPVPVTSVTIEGLDVMNAGEAAHYSASANSLVDPSVNVWTVTPDGFDGSQVIGPTVDVTAFGSFTISVSVTGIAGGTATASRHVTVLNPVSFVETIPTGSSPPSIVAQTNDAAPSWLRMASTHHRGDGAVFAQVTGISSSSPLRIEVYSVDGRRVASAERSASRGSVMAWEPAGSAPGLYFIRVHAGAKTTQQRLLLLP